MTPYSWYLNSVEKYLLILGSKSLVDFETDKSVIEEWYRMRVSPAQVAILLLDL